MILNAIVYRVGSDDLNIVSLFRVSKVTFLVLVNGRYNINASKFTETTDCSFIGKILAPMLRGPDGALVVLDEEVVLGRQLLSQSTRQLQNSVEFCMSGQWHCWKVVGPQLQPLEIVGQNLVLAPQADDVDEVGVHRGSANGGTGWPIRSSCKRTLGAA